MLAFLEGTLAYLDDDAVVVAVGGVGYRVAVPRAVGEPGTKITLFLAEVIREDRFDLYGFSSRDELSFFHRLTAIDGVGPKMALKILAAGTLSDVHGKIQKGDLAFLTSISGVGKKTAQKIILDLKGQIVADEQSAADPDVVDALTSLGYSRADLDGVLPHLTGDTAEERIKSALKMLAKR